jgi:hypothetical protein
VTENIPLTKFRTPATPAGGGLSAKWRSTREHGAILLTSDPVIERTAEPTLAMCDWMQTNAKAIIASNRDAKDKGIWLVTKTYHVPRCAIGLFKSRGAEKSVSGNVNVAGAGKVELSTTWWKERKDAGWVIYENVSRLLSPPGKPLWYVGVCNSSTADCQARKRMAW